MKIQVLGSGCSRCKQLYAEAEKAISASGVAAQLEKVERIEEIVKFGVRMTPALVIDGEVKAAGRIAPVSEIAGIVTFLASDKAAFTNGQAIPVNGGLDWAP